MEKIFGTYDEKYLKAVVLYAEGDDGDLCYDTAYENTITKDELVDLFMKGVVRVELNGVYYIPTSLSVNDETGIASVTAAGDGVDYVFNSTTNPVAE